MWATEREARWCEALVALVSAGKTEAEARELVGISSPVMVWRPDQLGAFLNYAGFDWLYALYHLIAYRG